jgi:hypothetical protein
VDWKRVGRLLNTPVEKLRARFAGGSQERRLAAWEKSMETQARELTRITEMLRQALERRRAALAEVKAYEERAEQALRDGDEAKARGVLLSKQDAAARLAQAKEESEALGTAMKRARDRMSATRAEANAFLAEAGLPPLEEADPDPDPDAPRVRVKI